MLKLDLDPPKISRIQEKLFTKTSPGFDAFLKNMK